MKIRLRTEKNHETGEIVRFKDDIFHYLRNVLKVSEGEDIYLFNDKFEYYSSIIEINKKEIIIDIHDAEDINETLNTLYRKRNYSINDSIF